MGRKIHMMWNQPNRLRGGTVGSIFVKNLDKAIDNEEFFTTFSKFGGILSSKVVKDKNGESKGSGLLHYQTEESALSAIKHMNGTLLCGRELSVQKFKSKDERAKQFEEKKKQNAKTNLYVKNIALFVTDDMLNDAFKPYGNITSTKIMRDANGMSKGFGFVCFASLSEAEKAKTELNGKVVWPSTKPLYVGFSQQKEERKALLEQQNRTSGDALLSGPNNGSVGQQLNGSNQFLPNPPNFVNGLQQPNQSLPWGWTAGPVVCGQNEFYSPSTLQVPNQMDSMRYRQPEMMHQQFQVQPAGPMGYPMGNRGYPYMPVTGSNYQAPILDNAMFTAPQIRGRTPASQQNLQQQQTLGNSQDKKE